MAARVLDGRATAKAIRAELAERVLELRGRNVVPGLTAILVGDDPASAAYVRMKSKAADEVGISAETMRLSTTTPLEDLLGIVESLNDNDGVHGILVQLPLPGDLAKHEQLVIESVRPDKDVDGFHPLNLGRTLSGLTPPDTFWPATPYGVVELLRRNGITPAGKRVVVVGRSTIVGKPVAAILSGKTEYGDATVTLAHSRTPDLPAVCREADILISAAGRAGLITREYVKPDAVVVDVGTNRVDDSSAKRGYRLVGDVSSEVALIAGWLSPVPGGVGPMTIAMLLSNTVQSAMAVA
jgi:methylenetetrahydrofolate dehydrogenase (NADP+)/methenyltetrahydrofolate cyclohydrolase